MTDEESSSFQTRTIDYCYTEEGVVVIRSAGVPLAMSETEKQTFVLVQISGVLHDMRAAQRLTLDRLQNNQCPTCGAQQPGATVQ